MREMFADSERDSGSAPAWLARSLAPHDGPGARTAECSGRFAERARVHVVHVAGGVADRWTMRRAADDRLPGRCRLRHMRPRVWVLGRLGRRHVGRGRSGCRGGAGRDRGRTAVAQGAVRWVRADVAAARYQEPHDEKRGRIPSRHQFLQREIRMEVTLGAYVWITGYLPDRRRKSHYGRDAVRLPRPLARRPRGAEAAGVQWSRSVIRRARVFSSAEGRSGGAAERR